MEALERSGNVAEALRVYDRLRVVLRDELGIAPSPAVQDVYRRLLGSAATRAGLSNLLSCQKCNNNNYTIVFTSFLLYC